MAYAVGNGYDVSAISFDYGQRHNRELESSRRISEYYKVPHKIIKVDLRQIGGSALTSDEAVPSRELEEIKEEIPVTYVPSRNTIFLSIAMAYAETINANQLFIGANAVDYSGYPDCRPEYFNSLQNTLALGTKIGLEEGVVINVPLQYLTKSEIIKLGTRLGVPYDLTTSCYRGGAKACGECDSCLLRLKGFHEAGIQDPIEYEKLPGFYSEFIKD